MRIEWPENKSNFDWLTWTSLLCKILAGNNQLCSAQSGIRLDLTESKNAYMQKNILSSIKILEAEYTKNILYIP